MYTHKKISLLVQKTIAGELQMQIIQPKSSQVGEEMGTEDLLWKCAKHTMTVLSHLYTGWKETMHMDLGFL